MSLVDLSQADMDLLKSTAIQALNMAVIEHRHLTVYGNIPELLMSVGASFVTLIKQGQLRGCIGTLDAYRPLIEDIAGNSYSAAMQDPRFPAVVIDELDELELSLSVLSTPQELNIESETQLQRSIRPGIDGVILQEGMSRATYLPSVWEQLPDAACFIKELKCKAGLPKDYWSSTIKCFKYQTLIIK